MGEHRLATRRRAEARVQQLCCMGLSQQVLIPLLLRELHQLVPSHWNLFFWFDAEGNISNLYNEYPSAMDVTPLYLNEFHNSRELEVFKGWSHVCRHANGATEFGSFLTVRRQEFQRHPFYQEVLKPAELHWMLQATVSDGSRPLGLVGLSRTATDAPFAKADFTQLDCVTGFIAHGMTNAGTRRQDDWIDSDDEGLIVCDHSSVIHHVSSRARLLLALATREQFKPRLSRLSMDRLLPAPLTALTRALNGIRDQRPGSRPPSIVLENAWGRFRFNATWLSSPDDGDSLIGITVRRQEPLPLKLMRHVEQLRIPRRQAQVCLLMACGHSYTRIAEHLGISENTVISHGRAVYNRVDAHNRSELIGRLLALDPENTLHGSSRS